MACAAMACGLRKMRALRGVWGSGMSVCLFSPAPAQRLHSAHGWAAGPWNNASQQLQVHKHVRHFPRHDAARASGRVFLHTATCRCLGRFLFSISNRSTANNKLLYHCEFIRTKSFLLDQDLPWKRGGYVGHRISAKMINATSLSYMPSTHFHNIVHVNNTGKPHGKHNNRVMM